jgi:hypothetical protein
VWFDLPDCLKGDQMTKRATHALGAGALLLAGLLAGCGGDDDGGSGDKGFADQSYDKIKAAALEAMDSLEAVHAELSIEADGQSFATDVRMSTDGNCSGTVTIGEASAEMLRVDGEGWYKPNRVFLEQILPGQSEAATEFVGDSWVVDSEDVQTGSNCDLEELVDSLSDDEAETDTEVVGVEELDGQEVVKLAYTNSEGDGTAYVLAEGEHYLVKIALSGDVPAAAEFSEFDEDVTTEPPADDEVVDLADLQS